MKVYVKIPVKRGAKKMFDLKEIGLSELMEEFAERVIGNFSNFSEHPQKELINQFLTEKGYIQL